MFIIVRILKPADSTLAAGFLNLVFYGSCCVSRKFSSLPQRLRRRDTPNTPN
jgi:hypothetical protein